jgi:hypothetical protein
MAQGLEASAPRQELNISYKEEQVIKHALEIYQR